MFFVTCSSSTGCKTNWVEKSVLRPEGRVTEDDFGTVEHFLP